MSQLHFAQISDTHILKDYSSGLLHNMFDSLISPDEKLIQTLQELKKESLDFIVITGDLVNEGDEADYELVGSEMCIRDRYPYCWLSEIMTGNMLFARCSIRS